MTPITKLFIKAIHYSCRESLNSKSSNGRLSFNTSTMQSIIFLLLNVLALVNANEIGVEDIVQTNFKNVLSRESWSFADSTDENEINSKRDELCAKHISLLMQGITNGSDLWALKMLDAWGKFPSGILSGNLYEFGSYDQCIKISHETQSEALGRIQGQYCLISVPIKKAIGIQKTNFGQADIRAAPAAGEGLALMIGACYPKSCREEYLQNITGTFLSQLNITAPKNIVKCQKESNYLEVIDIVAIVFFTFIGVCLLSSTIYEVVMLKRNFTPSPLLVAFSMYTNSIKLFKCQKSKPLSNVNRKSDIIECVNGIRVLSIVWVVLCHSYFMVIATPMINFIGVIKWISTYHSMLVVAASVSVDSFFLLSGLLIGWAVLKELEKKNGRLNVPMMYLHRYLRLTPAYAAVILFVTSLMKYSGSGPIWQSTFKVSAEPCKRYWWSALLYIQNYVNPVDVCVGQSWYLSVDMQLYILAPIVVYPLWRWGKRIVPVICTLIILSMGCVFATFLVNDYRTAFIAENNEKFEKTYSPTHTRMGAWLVGVILGYILYSTRNVKLEISKLLVALGWTLSLGTMVAIIFGLYPLQQLDFHKNPAYVDAIYESMSRVCWATSLAWIVFACVNGYGGFINTFLSLTFWQPLGRLSYCIYLIHMPLQLMLLGSIRSPQYFSDVNVVHKFWGDFGITVTIAVLWSLAFESPIVGLEKIIFRTGQRTQAKRSLIAPSPSASTSISSNAIITVDKEPI